MKPPQHITPGQWEQSTFRGKPETLVVSSAGDFVAELHYQPLTDNSEEELANAKLIAQAKRMAEILNRIVEDNQTHGILWSDAHQVLLDAGWEEGE